MSMDHVLSESILDGSLPEKVTNHVGVPPMRISALCPTMLCETLIVRCDVCTAFIPIVETSVTEIEAAPPNSFGRESADYLVGVRAVVATMGLLVMILELVNGSEDATTCRMWTRPIVLQFVSFLFVVFPCS